MQEGDLKKILTFLTVILFFGSLFSPAVFGNKFNDKRADLSIKNQNIPKSKELLSSKSMISTSSIIGSPKSIVEDNLILPKKNLESKFISNLLITDSPFNESYPSLISRGYSALIGYQNDDILKIFLRKSSDYGQNWSNEFQIEVFYNLTEPDIDAIYPDVSFNPSEDKVYGTYICPKGNFGVNGFFVLPDIEGDLDEITTYTLDWTFPEWDFSFWGFKNPGIAAYDNDTNPWVIAMIGSTNYTDETGLGPCNNSTMLMFNDLYDPDFITLVWFPDIINCNNLSVVNDFYHPDIYAACEIHNNDSSDIFFFKGNPQEWSYSYTLENKTFSLVNGNLTHPNIYSKDNHVFIVTEAESEESKDILLFHSFNNGYNWNIYNITADILPSDALPKYPSIYANKNQVSCMFSESEDLFFINSTDFGKTWTEPIKLNYPNGTIVGGYRNSEIASLNQFVWTDNRDGDTNIYASLKSIPCCPSIPDISGNKYGRVGIEYDYSFVSTSSQNQDIFYYIDWGDGTSEEWLGPFNSSEEITLTHSWISNGEFIIRAKARNEKHFESEWTDPFELIIDDINPEISIIKPVKGLYLFNNLIRTFFLRMPLIIGDFEIEVNASDFGSGIEKVEFYDGLLGNRLLVIDTTWPYTYNWIGDRPRLVHISLIRVVAYDYGGLQDEAHILVRKLL